MTSEAGLEIRCEAEKKTLFSNRRLILSQPCCNIGCENPYTLKEILNKNESTTEDTTDTFQMITCLIVDFKCTVCLLTLLDGMHLTNGLRLCVAT